MKSESCVLGMEKKSCIREDVVPSKSNEVFNKSLSLAINNPISIFYRLCQITDFPLPLSTIIHDCLKMILKSRISIANKYVLRIFMDEYKVLDHLINLQRVFFFGAGDLMLTFYSKLFKSVSCLQFFIKDNNSQIIIKFDNNPKIISSKRDFFQIPLKKKVKILSLFHFSDEYRRRLEQLLPAHCSTR